MHLYPGITVASELLEDKSEMLGKMQNNNS